MQTYYVCDYIVGKNTGTNSLPIFRKVKAQMYKNTMIRYQKSNVQELDFRSQRSIKVRYYRILQLSRYFSYPTTVLPTN
jgi:hypothetical protein